MSRRTSVEGAGAQRRTRAPPLDALPLDGGPSNSTIRFVRARPNPIPSRLRVLPLCFAYFCAAVSQQPDFAHVCRHPFFSSSHLPSQFSASDSPGTGSGLNSGPSSKSWAPPPSVEETDRALQDRLDRTEQERDALERRVQNLAAIVTSETWDALHDSGTDSSSLPERAQSILRRHRPEPDNPPGNEPTSWPAAFKRSPCKQSIVEGFAFSARTPTLAST